MLRENLKGTVTGEKERNGSAVGVITRDRCG